LTSCIRYRNRRLAVLFPCVYRSRITLTLLCLRRASDSVSDTQLPRLLLPSKYRSAQIYCTQKKRQSERNSFIQRIHHECSSRITHTMIQHITRHCSISTAVLAFIHKSFRNSLSCTAIPSVNAYFPQVRSNSICYCFDTEY
ncbi:hypothetical protein T10_576, partial [Trichinella papuae]